MGAGYASNVGFPKGKSAFFCGEDVERCFSGQGRVRCGAVETVSNIGYVDSLSAKDVNETVVGK